MTRTSMTWLSHQHTPTFWHPLQQITLLEYGVSTQRTRSSLVPFFVLEKVISIPFYPWYVSNSCDVQTALLIAEAFHGTGRYILSGGQDHIVNMVCSYSLCSRAYQEITRFQWTLPEIPYNQVESQRPIVVHFPHFSTSEVHSNIVDWWAFYHIPLLMY